MDPTWGKLFGAIGHVAERPVLFTEHADPEYIRWYALQWLKCQGFATPECDLIISPRQTDGDGSR